MLIKIDKYTHIYSTVNIQGPVSDSQKDDNEVLCPAKGRNSIAEQTQAPQAKGKAIPVRAWTGSKGSTVLRLPHFKTIGTCRR
jgi:hypothetical protein